MIRVVPEPWREIVAHACMAYPNECVGAMLGRIEGDEKEVLAAMRLENAAPGSQRTRYELRKEDMLGADQEAARRGLFVIGFYHSHPDCDAYFSETDLKNSCPWYSFVVLSVQKGEFKYANCWLPNLEQTEAKEEELIHA